MSPSTGPPSNGRSNSPGTATRRRTLARAGTALLATAVLPLAGAAATATGDDGMTDSDDPTTDEDGTSADEHSNDEDESTGPYRGESDERVAITVEEDDEYVEYLEDEEKVQYVEAWRASDREDDDEPPEREPVFGTADWEWWGELRTTSAAADAAAEHVAAELGTEVVPSGSVSNVDGNGRAAVLWVVEPADGDDEGNEIDVDEVVAATPATVDATYVLDGREFEHSVAIFVKVLHRVETGDTPDHLHDDYDADEDAAAAEDADEAIDADDDAHWDDAEDDAYWDDSTDNARDDDGGNDANATGTEDPTKDGSTGTNSTDAVPGFGFVAALGGVLAMAGAARLRTSIDQ